jgi:DNA phosphorothioation-associated putative methyltransferase
MTTVIHRHKTAISRTGLSRPFRLAFEYGLISEEQTVFDYGCGRGDDLTHLLEMGIQTEGWDPSFRPDSSKYPSDIVNIGYVVNVIEDPEEREVALKSAWSLTNKLLIVSGRLKSDVKEILGDHHSDGILTGSNTFQKFYTQNELKEWIEKSLDNNAISAAPGVFFLFRSEEDSQSYLASRYRNRRSAPRLRKSDILFSEHKEILDPLMQFMADRGRLPAAWELPECQRMIEVFGSVRKAFSVVRRVTGIEQWEALRLDRLNELLVQFALSGFRRRPKFGTLPLDLQLDIRDYFSSYKEACEIGDSLLFSTGNMTNIDQSIRDSVVGKVTGNSLYIHVDTLPFLDRALRIYEGCAKAFIGDVENANIIKLHRKEAKVSYLSYPDFDVDPHPALKNSVLVDLRRPDAHFRNYSNSLNPPILHRKELFLPPEDPRREKFTRLTKQEERYGLFEETASIGTKDGWERVLEFKNVSLRGHRLIRKR